MLWLKNMLAFFNCAMLALNVYVCKLLCLLFFTTSYELIIFRLLILNVVVYFKLCLNADSHHMKHIRKKSGFSVDFMVNGILMKREL